MAMSFQALNLALANDTDANFRLWGGGISVALAAVGLVKTSDTGQINWATVLTPSAINQKRGYEIWRFDDTLQATRPVFIRLDYGSGANTAWNPMIWFTIGTATDGAGNITASGSFPNALHAVKTVFYTPNAPWWSTTKALIYVSSDGAASLVIGGWMNVPTSQNPTVSGGVLIAERTRDWDGTPNGEGVLTILQAGGSTTPTSQALIIANAATYTQGSAWTGVPAIAGGTIPAFPRTGMIGSGVINVFPVFTGTTPQLNGPSKHVVAVWTVDVPGWGRFPLTVYGDAGTYLSLGSTLSGWESNGLALSGAIRIA